MAIFSIVIILLAIIGGITLFFIVLHLFTTLHEGKYPPFVSSPLSYEDEDSFLKTLANTINSHVDYCASPKILINGAEFLPDIIKEIENATKRIYIANYLWDDGTFGTKLFRALVKKAKAGVCVRVLVDAVGGHKIKDEVIKELQDAGGKIKYFRPMRWWNITRWHRRSHLRNIVIDGEIGYLGGIAFTDEWLGDADTPTKWHDYMFKVSGLFSNRLEKVFTHMWSQRTGEILQVENVTFSNNQKNKFILLFSSPAPDSSSDLEHFIWLSIVAAQKTIYIENPYILPSKSIKEALISKAKSGIDVRIIGPHTTDAQQVKLASELYYKELLQSGIKIYEYAKSRIHAKTMVIDGIWSIIGSANLDNRSSRINLELIAGVYDKHLAEELEEIFLKDLENSIEITYTHKLLRNFWKTPLRLLSAIFVRQY